MGLQSSRELFAASAWQFLFAGEEVRTSAVHGIARRCCQFGGWRRRRPRLPDRSLDSTAANLLLPCPAAGAAQSGAGCLSCNEDRWQMADDR